MAFEQKEYFRKAAVEGPGSMTMDKIDVLGIVEDGEDLVQWLCRITMKIGDFESPVFGCYPVRKGESAWEHLNDKDKKELVKALRSKWTP